MKQCRGGLLGRGADRAEGELRSRIGRKGEFAWYGRGCEPSPDRPGVWINLALSLSALASRIVPQSALVLFCEAEQATRLAAHLLGATGSLAAPVAAHVLANHFGLPDFAGAGGRPAVMLAYVIGVGAFAALLRRGPFVL